jgi:hypothetical protein
MLQTVLSVILVVWFIASVINQFEWKWWTPVRALDCFSVLPRWTFFAPRPGTNDVRVVYRDVLEGGVSAAWRELPTAPYRSVVVRMFWNPEKLDNKAVFDLVQMMGMEIEAFKSHPRAALISVPYLQLLDPIMQLPRPVGAVARQFALVTTRGHEAPREPTILMVSPAHPFSRA